MTEPAPDAPATARLRRWLRPAVLAMEPYAAAPLPAAASEPAAKLDAMELPYALPAALRARCLRQLRIQPLHRYPDADAGALRRALRAALDIPDSLALLPGNGSDELILYLTLALAGRGRKVLAPEPTFVMYRRVAAMAGMEYVGVPLRPDDFALDPEAMRAAIVRHRPAIVWLAWPNNPTGALFDEEAVRQVVRAAPGIVVADEAYFPYSRRTLLGAVSEYEHLLVLRTLSKMGLAALRIGVLIGAPHWLEQLEKLRLPYNVGALNQVCAAHLLGANGADYSADFEPLLERNRAARQKLYRALRRLDGVEVWPSHANFLLLRLAAAPADAVHRALRRRGVLVKNLHGSHPSLRQCLRVSVGAAAENRLFLRSLREALRAHGGGASPRTGTYKNPAGIQ